MYAYQQPAGIGGAYAGGVHNGMEGLPLGTVFNNSNVHGIGLHMGNINRRIPSHYVDNNLPGMNFLYNKFGTTI